MLSVSGLDTIWKWILFRDDYFLYLKELAKLEFFLWVFAYIFEENN